MSVPLARQRRPVAGPHRCAMPCHPPIGVAGGAGVAQRNGGDSGSLGVKNTGWCGYRCKRRACELGNTHTCVLHTQRSRGACDPEREER